ncbi:MAG: hypothetical protein MUC97_10565 [Bernardetiaceae bacterium]|jgi:hypothetical protein|nr:hypothetical protein [Bernardetiaceae bacterium]
MEPITIKVHPVDALQIKALRAFMVALDIKFEEDTPAAYNPAFIDMIRTGEEDLKAGKGIKMTLDELNALWK